MQEDSNEVLHATDRAGSFHRHP